MSSCYSNNKESFNEAVLGLKSPSLEFANACKPIPTAIEKELMLNVFRFYYRRVKKGRKYKLKLTNFGKSMNRLRRKIDLSFIEKNELGGEK